MVFDIFTNLQMNPIPYNTQASNLYIGHTTTTIYQRLISHLENNNVMTLAWCEQYSG